MAYYINKILHLHSQWYRLCDGGLDSSDDLCCVSIRSWGGGSHERGSAGVEAFHGTGLLEDLAVAGHEHQVSFRRSTLTRLRCEYSWGYRLHSPLLKRSRLFAGNVEILYSFLSVSVSQQQLVSMWLSQTASPPGEQWRLLCQITWAWASPLNHRRYVKTYPLPPPLPSLGS